MIKIKCNECGRKMIMKDSNTYDSETWYGYECECGNVEIETFKIDMQKDYMQNEKYDLIDNTNNFRCTKCDGLMVKYHSNATYVCKECKHVICEEVLLMITCEKIKSGGL